MRITNNMMINNTSSNINGNKINVNALNLQMSSQKKIQRPSENPVVAIRALRLRSTLSQIDQYYEKNIPDAQAWLEATETALKNMNKILTDVKTECVSGTNSYLTADDRNTILKNLTALKDQLYSEGNADDAGRTVFTGYKTGSRLTFMEDEPNTTYEITQNISYQEIEEYSYYLGSVEIPATVEDVQKIENISDIVRLDYDRVRLAYDDIGDATGQIVYKDGTVDNSFTWEYYDSEADWEAAHPDKVIGDTEIVVLKDKGDVIFGKEASNLIKSEKATIRMDYKKEGFSKGELRPEYYYDCKDTTDPANTITYDKYYKDSQGNYITDANGNYKKIYEDINYVVSLNQTLTVNLQADEVFDMSIYQDVVELMNTVQNAINAHEKVDRLKEMKTEAKYADYQEEIQKWIDGAQKEADYADSRLTELYSAGIGKFDKYMEKLNVAYTEVGARGDQLEMTESRISNLQLTQEELKSCNEDKELSDIIIEYTAAFNAYQASLLSASKIEKQTLLDYI